MKKAIRSYLIGAVFLSLVPASAGAIPGVIGDLTALAIPAEGAVNLAWTSPDPMDGEAQASGYLVKYATSEIKNAGFDAVWVSTYTQSWTAVPSGAAEIRTLTGLEPGVTFYFAMKARDKDGNYSLWNSSSDTGGLYNSAAFAVVCDSTPARVAGLSASGGNTLVQLSWSANPEIDIERYRIERSSYSSQEGFSLLTTILPPGTTHYDAGLINGNTYYYRARAEDRTGHAGDFSVTAGTMPWVSMAIPAFTSFAVAGSTHTLNWAWNPSGGALDYSIVSSTSGETLSGTLGPTATYWIQAGLL
ncbi:MAG: fibronectin type III domain-containing protein, partial [Endomicrobiales bacterium]